MQIEPNARSVTMTSSSKTHKLTAAKTVDNMGRKSLNFPSSSLDKKIVDKVENW